MGKGDGSRQQLSSGSVGTHDVSLVELALEVVDDVGAGGEVRRHEDVGPVVGPARVALIVVRRRRRPLLRLLRVRPGPCHRRGWSLGLGFWSTKTHRVATRVGEFWQATPNERKPMRMPDAMLTEWGDAGWGRRDEQTRLLRCLSWVASPC